MPKKSLKKFNFDVYDENENEFKEKKSRLDHVIGVDLETKIDKKDDEEITEDEAFDSEDEQKYGMFFQQEQEEELEDNEEYNQEYLNLSDLINQKDSSESEESSIDFSEDEQEEQLQDLSNILKPKTKKRKKEVTEAFEESEFHVSRKVKMTDLVEDLQDHQFQSLQKQMDLVQDQKVLDKPLAPLLQDRVNRVAAKEEALKSVAKWIPLVKKNRESDVLELNTQDTTNIVSSKTIASSFTPFTDLEKEITKVLEDSGLTDKKLMELEELELNKLDMDEIEERRIELQKLRSLMFFKEQKQKKISKIKSKTYRKLNKKKDISVEELEQVDPERAKEERDKLEFLRAKERMTLKHKNTGKWAKRMMGRHDIETQKEVMEQLRKGDELRKRIRGFDDSEDDDSEGEDVMEKLEQLEKEVDEINTNKGLFGMKFMQRGLEKQKQETRDMIQEAKQEFMGSDGGSNHGMESDDGMEDRVVSKNGRHVFGIQPSHNSVPPVVEEEGEKPEKTVFMAKASGPVQVKQQVSVPKQEPLFKVDSFGDPVEPERPKPKPHSKAKDKVTVVKETVDESESNPWIKEDVTAVKKSIDVSHKDFQKTSKDTKAILKIAAERNKQIKNNDDDQEEIVALVESDSEPENQVPEVVSSSNVHKLDSKKIMQMAFANDMIAEDFQKEKEEIAELESGKTIETGLPGWGDWAGPGIKARVKTTVVYKPDGVDISKRRDKHLKHVIINEKKNKKIAKYMLPKLPHGFENKRQYERTLATPLGKEWNTLNSHKKLVQPRVNPKAGTIIHPMKFVGNKKKNK